MRPADRIFSGSHDERPRIPCALCGGPTPMLATRRCDWCWELEGRIERDPIGAQAILDRVNRKEPRP